MHLYNRVRNIESSFVLEVVQIYNIENPVSLQTFA